MSFAAIFFDMDGTLLETGPLWDRATRIALGAHSIEFTQEEYFSLGGTLIHDVLARKGYGAETIRSVHTARDAALTPVMREDARWRPGAKEAVAAIAVPKGVVTSAHLSIVNTIDVAIGIKSAVDVFITAEDVEPDYKPSPKGLILACEQLKVDPTRCVYVGDQACDTEAAANAGMKGILLRGSQTPKDLAHPFTIDDPSQLSDMLAKIAVTL